eukprot:TRINITY_DN555_c0_g1_i1.p1 TRINITY_DN555_c0_g1~~TRINITY_DN555_c0_g1_i1.p1  ORF type:complete len:146 (-),score=38.82 TRINITY_DN555_c0_g1_i1:55-444(-)
MSWQAYVDKNLVGTGHCVQAAIVGHNGAVWAKTAGFNIAPAEATALVKGFTAPPTPSPLFASGIHLNKVRYIAIGCDAAIVRGKKGAGGVHAVKTKQAVLIAIYGDKTQPGQCAVVVEKLADYLKEQGY